MTHLCVIYMHLILSYLDYCSDSQQVELYYMYYIYTFIRLSMGQDFTRALILHLGELCSKILP